MMLRKLTEEAWIFYLKILDIERIPGYSIDHEIRLNRLTDQTYYRYVRRRDAFELQIMGEKNNYRQRNDVCSVSQLEASLPFRSVFSNYK